MKRHFFAVPVFSCLLQAQPSEAKAASVAPGEQSAIILAVRSPRVGDMIDILANNLNGGVRVDIFMPDGRELKDDALQPNGFVLTGLVEGDRGVVDPSVRKALLSGRGDHLVLLFVDRPRGGNYRIRIDNRTASAPVRVEAVFVRVAGILLDSLRSTPGVKIANTIRVRPRSTGAELRLALTQSSEEAMIDVASTDDRIAIRLRLPDGTVVTPENARAKGLEWHQMRYPPDDISDGDPFAAPFVASALAALTLPVDGMHYQIQFPAGVCQGGTYTVEADGRRSTATAEVSAMFVPIKNTLQQVEEEFRRLTSPPVK